MESKEESHSGIFGLSWKQVILYGILVVLIVRIILRLYRYVFIIKKIPQRLRHKREIYKQSEAYFFKKFESSVKKDNTRDIIEKLYQWIGRLEVSEPTLQYLARTYGNADLISFSNRSIDEFSSEEWRKQINNFINVRKRYLGRTSQKSLGEDKVWINP